MMSMLGGMGGGRFAGLGSAIHGMSGMNASQLGGMLGSGPLSSGAGAVLGGALSARMDGAEFTPEMVRSSFMQGAGMGLRTAVGRRHMQQNPPQIEQPVQMNARQRNAMDLHQSHQRQPLTPEQARQMSQHASNRRGPLSNFHQFQQGSKIVDPIQDVVSSTMERLGRISGWLQQRGAEQ
jgi:hypothetical protein